MIYVIFILCLILFVIAIYVLRKLSKQYKTLQEIYYLQKLMLSHSQFTNDANEMILWKIRYDIWCWNENLVPADLDLDALSKIGRVVMLTTEDIFGE